MRHVLSLLLLLAGACVVPTPIDLREDLGDADHMIVAVVSPGGYVEASILPREPNLVLDLDPRDTVFVWPLDSARDLSTASGDPLPRDVLDDLRVTVDGSLSRRIPEPPLSDTSSAGACGRCLAEATAAPQPLFSGDACPIPAWRGARRIDVTGALGSDRPADPARRLRIAVPGRCPCAPAVLRPSAHEPVLEPVTRKDDPWPARAVVLRPDGATALLSERSYRLIDASGRATVIQEPPPVTEAVIAASNDPEGGIALLTLGSSLRHELLRLGPRLEPRGRTPLEGFGLVRALRSFPESRAVYLLGSRAFDQTAVSACEGDACLPITPAPFPWTDGVSGRFQELLRMPDGLLVAITDDFDVAFGAPEAAVRPGTALAAMSASSNGWTWRGASTQAGFTVRCTPGVRPCSDGATLRPRFRGGTAARFGWWVVLCGSGDVAGVAHDNLVWARTASIDTATGPGAGWTVLHAAGGVPACDSIVRLPAEGASPEALRIFGDGRALVDVAGRGGALVAETPGPAFDFGFAAPDTAARVLEGPGVELVAVSADGRVSRGPRQRGSRFTVIHGGTTPAERARWSGPVVASGDRFTVYGVDGMRSEISVPPEGPIEVRAPPSIAGLAACGDVTAAARDGETGDTVLAGWRSGCAGACAAAGAACPGPWLYRVDAAGVGARIPLGEALRGSTIDVVLATGRDEWVIAGGPTIFRLRGGALEPLGGLVPGGRTCARAPLDPRYDGEPGWRTGSAAAGVAWLGGCRSTAARVIGGKVEMLDVQVEPARERSTDFTAAAAFCADHAVWVAAGSSGDVNGWSVEPGQRELKRWRTADVDPTGFYPGVPVAMAAGPSSALIFWGGDSLGTASGGLGGSLLEVGRGELADYPVSFRAAARSESGAVVVTAEGGRVYAIRP